VRNKWACAVLIYCTLSALLIGANPATVVAEVDFGTSIINGKTADKVQEVRK
jgi:hypothetical protein